MKDILKKIKQKEKEYYIIKMEIKNMKDILKMVNLKKRE